MDVIERSKALFKDRLSQDVIDLVESWDEEQQDYFWTCAYYTFEQILDARMVEAVMRGEGGVNPVGIAGIVPESPSATPFRDAEHSIHPGKWFTSGAVSMIRR